MKVGTMTGFELSYMLLEPFISPLYLMVRRTLGEIARYYPSPPAVLDVGGRKSHYTIGVPATVTISDLPRTTDVQYKLNLGISEDMIGLIRKRRSNVHQVIYDDMTKSALLDCSFDCVVAVEVLEHVEDDVAFVQHVYRILKPGGHFVMTTPNGDFFDFQAVNNPDNKRFYTREVLRLLLSSVLNDVQVVYAIPSSRFAKRGKVPWSRKQPLGTAVTMLSNAVNSIETTRATVREQARNTKHLLAVGRKRSH
jgi:SAM-dependent methyltransferase